MKKIGVLGGMGPMAGVKFYQDLILQTEAKRDQEHFDVVLLGHASIPDRSAAILSGNAKPFLDAVREDYKLFDQAGCELICITCNTSHYYFDEMQSMTEIPIFNMVRNALEHSAEKAMGSPVIVLCTDGTRQAGVYDRFDEGLDVEVLYPDEEEQRVVMDTIYEIKAGDFTGAADVIEIAEAYIDRGMRVILACTELSEIEFPDELLEHIDDAMGLMAKDVAKKKSK